MEVHYHPKARQAGKDNNKIEPMKKIISSMHISLDGFVADPNGEMNWIKVDEEIFDHVPFSRQLYKIV